MRCYSFSVVTLFFLFFSVFLSGQTKIDLNKVFNDKYSPLYNNSITLDDRNIIDTTISNMVNEIINFSGITSNFNVKKSLNYEDNVIAIYDTTQNQRYIVIDDFFLADKFQNDGLKLKAALAYNIARHQYAHEFSEERKVIEELEAHFFLGFVLGKMSKKYPSLKWETQILDTILPVRPINYIVNLEERKNSLKSGWEKGQTAQEILSLNFEGKDVSKYNEPGFKFFSCSYATNSYAKIFPTQQKPSQYNDVKESLYNLMNNKLLKKPHILSCKGGFAIVSELEEYNSSTYNRSNRWPFETSHSVSENIIDIFFNLFNPGESTFRVFVVIVSEYDPHNPHHLTDEEIKAWKTMAFPTGELPKNIGNKAWTNTVKIWYSVVEIYKDNGNGAKKISCPGESLRSKHIIMSDLKQLMNQ